MKYQVTVTTTIDVEVEEDYDGHDAIEVAKIFLDHEDDEVEYKRKDLPLSVWGGSAGKVLTYDITFHASQVKDLTDV